ncbi:hypothetical protein [Xenorhabdus innexi]|uniref:Uncharacterized protein n=1 Tax=Xenorhabdus innexi TaxID=290109 RepID=A0A1N6MZG6_9GAMM|nr:hypothetical protein [Xenorhabdus innexi]PHM30028.1 hypothetical protein Xinn_03611 [Xenorhabdus innexi]SIP74164.1 exported hypothetical protein [Xenorhabdus innexi]
MFKKIAAAFLLFPCALLADSGVYTGEDGKLAIRDGNYFCQMYPAHLFNDPRNLNGFPSGYYPQVVMSVSTDKDGKYLSVDLHPGMAFDVRPSGSWGYVSAALGTGSSSASEVTYHVASDNNNFAYVIGTKNAGVIAALSSTDAFSPVNAVLGQCNRIN